MYTLYDVLTRDFRNGTDKIIWLLVVIFLPLLGTILWFLVGRSSSFK
ncbi:hypothetical protein A3SI_07404 [Nitritalea halalkaliphila LW7]|uniref:Cardiolipin synthase N-terminal domain-containing protein n=1 Tax=Nitritalea halalkaliphila LW7 TaxID=1189621 RepID=I5C5K8_9BACT|nr:hypothetical protein A3SI_07404 [Nitritalea halalkaliphila LW7]